MKSPVKLFLLLLLIYSVNVKGQQTKSKSKALFQAEVQSLQQYECPEWFRDAKFGIYCHWNPQSASKSENNGWYARDMYIQGSPAYNDHLKNWGHPSKVGYKDIITNWKADKFNAKEWVDLFKKSGAKFIISMAVHHDNFDMWNSKYQPKWNSTKFGPEIDVCKVIKEETLKAGLRWGVTTHLERTYSWFQTNKLMDKTGIYKDIPYDGNNKADQDLYLPNPDFASLGSADDQLRHPLKSPIMWRNMWKNRMYDLIDNYDPDFFYFDGALPFMDDGGKSGMEVLAHYYNHNAAKHNGKNEGVMVIKNITRHGYFYPSVSSIALERQYADSIQESPQVTDESIGPWFHTGTNAEYKSTEDIINLLTDVVSKNCNFLLNIPAKADGSFDEDAKTALIEIGNWMKVNGSAIYGTRPWKTFGEGSVRFTTTKDTLNVILRQKPINIIFLGSFKGWKEGDIKTIELLGSNSKVQYHVTEEGLLIIPPKSLNPNLANVFKITSRNLALLPSTRVSLESTKKLNDDAESKFGADGQGNHKINN